MSTQTDPPSDVNDRSNDPSLVVQQPAGRQSSHADGSSSPQVADNDVHKAQQVVVDVASPPTGDEVQAAASDVVKPNGEGGQRDGKDRRDDVASADVEQSTAITTAAAATAETAEMKEKKGSSQLGCNDNNNDKQFEMVSRHFLSSSIGELLLH